MTTFGKSPKQITDKITSQTVRVPFRKRIRRVTALIFALAIGFQIVPMAYAHQTDTTEVKLRGLGGTGTFTIADLGTCSAELRTLVFNTIVASISPTGIVHAVSQTYTVTSNIAHSGSTSIDVSFTGEGTDANGDPCTEIGTITIEVTVGRAITSSGGTYSSSGELGDPVNTFTGEFYNIYPPDLKLGGPQPLFFQRYYSSRLLQDDIISSSLGDNWLHNFDWKLKHFENVIEIVSDRGQIIRFRDSDTSIERGSWVLDGDPDVPYQLVRSGAEFILGDPLSKRLYFFNAPSPPAVITGELKKIEFIGGKVHTLTYIGDKVSQVTDGLGRTLTFTYNGERLANVSDGTRTVSFGYSGTNLVSVKDVSGIDTIYDYADGALMTGATLPNGNTPLINTYDAEGRVLTQTDASGNTQTFAYDDATRVTTMTDPLANVIQDTHTQNGELISQLDESGQTVALGYDGDGQRNSITDRLGGKQTYTYHVSGQLASVNQADGSQSIFSYTARIVSGITFYDLTGITHADGTTSSFGHDAKGNLTSLTDRRGNTRNFSYDTAGQILTATNPAGGTYSFTYNADETPLSFTDPAGNTTTFGYDNLRRLNRITFADAATREFTYDSRNYVLTIKDRGGNTTSYAYDANGNMTAITDPLGNAITWVYDNMDRLTSITDSMNKSATREYDSLGRLKSYTKRDGSVIGLNYDERARLTSITDAASKVWTRSFDAESVIAAAADPLSNSRSYTSDAMGRITRYVSPLGNVTEWTYDSMGRVTATTNPAGETTTTSYNANGQVSSVALAGSSVVVSYERNVLGQITTVTDPNGSIWERAYDTQGRLTFFADPLANATSIDYDAVNRASRITLPEGTLDLTYDAFGNVTRKLYSDGTNLNYSYDQRNLITSTDGVSITYDANDRIVDSNGLTIARDDAGSVTSIIYAANKEVTYSYDCPCGLISSITDWLGGVTTFQYDDSGQLVSIQRPNGVTMINTYDGDGRIIEISEAGSLSTISLTRDGTGRIISAVRNVPQASSIASVSDATLSFDSASQVASFSYDNMGRLTSDDQRSYTWNLASRLTSYTEGSTVVDFTYDGLGNRLSRTEMGTTRDYVWNYGLVVPSVSIERDGVNDLRYFIHAPNGELLYSIEAADNSQRYYHFDEMGNTLFITDSGGNVIGAYDYSPYGTLLGSSGGLDNALTYQGKFGVRAEGSTGLYHMGARYYDSANARFISRDPVTTIGPKTANPYQYALANPLVFVDPLGLEGSYEDQTRMNIERRQREAEQRQREREEEWKRRQDEEQQRGEETARQRREEAEANRREAANRKAPARTRTRTPGPTPGSTPRPPPKGGDDDGDDGEDPRDTDPPTPPCRDPNDPWIGTIPGTDVEVAPGAGLDAAAGIVGGGPIPSGLAGVPGEMVPVIQGERRKNEILDECGIPRDEHRLSQQQFKEDVSESFFVNFLKALFGVD